MTEQEWMTSADPQAMMAFLGTSVRGVTYDAPTIAAGVPLISPRKLRLFACACCRAVQDGAACPKCEGVVTTWAGTQPNPANCWNCHGTGRVGGLTDPHSRRAVEVAERYADGEATARELEGAWREAFAEGWTDFDIRSWPRVAAVRPAELANPIHWLRFWGRAHAAVQAALLRCVAGNPWRPVVLSAYEPTPSYVERGVLGEMRVCPAAAGRVVEHPWLAWDGGTIPAMARTIYADRDWELLPQLADALEQAGCPVNGACPSCHGSGTYTVQVANPGLSAVNGYSTLTTYSEWRGCRHCGGDADTKGTGRVPHPLLQHCRGQDTGPCPACKGEGRRWVQAVLGEGMGPCRDCHGTGKAPAVHARGCAAIDLMLGKS